MPMQRRKLVRKQARPVRHTSLEKRALQKDRKTNRAGKKAYNKAYYRKNRQEILKRASQRRKRRSNGDVRTTRRQYV